MDKTPKSATKSLKIPGPTTCASSFGTALLLNALELPSLYAFSRQLAQYETGVKVPLSEKWQTACDWSASMNGSELSLKQTFVGEECVTSVCVGGYIHINDRLFTIPHFSETRTSVELPPSWFGMVSATWGECRNY